MPGNVGLRLQQLSTDIDRVLVAAEIAGTRTEDGWFTTPEVDAVFLALRVPRPSNTSANLARLSTRRLVVRSPAGRRWSVTPLGRQRVGLLLTQEEAAGIGQLQTGSPPGAEFGHAFHSVIPAALAPEKFLPAINRLAETYPPETNIFCMTRFPDGAEADALGRIIPALREAARCHGMTLHLASDRQLDDDLWGNVVAHMWACQYGVVLLEDRAGRGLNHNVSIELGGMLATGRRCALLKDCSAPSLPTDLVGQIYKPVDFDDVGGTVATFHAWLRDDLGRGSCAGCPA